MSTAVPSSAAGVLGSRTASLPLTGDVATAIRLSIVTAVLLAVSGAAGLVFGGAGLYPSDPVLLPQFYGQDLVALALALPTLGIGMWLARRGSVRGLVCWIGALVYIAYWYHFYLEGAPFGPLFLVHIALVSASAFAALLLVLRIDAEAFRRRFSTGLPAKALGRIIAGLGTLFALVWMTDIVSRLARGEALDAVARSVYVADLAVMLPLTIAAGLGLALHRAWGYVLAGPLLINALGSMITLQVTTILVDRAGESVGVGQVILFPVAISVMLGATAVYLRDLRL